MVLDEHRCFFLQKRCALQFRVPFELSKANAAWSHSSSNNYNNNNKSNNNHEVMLIVLLVNSAG